MSPLDTLIELDTASFAAMLPFSCEPRDPTQPLDEMLRETRLAMKVLAAPADSQDEPDPILLRLEAKLDLALEVSLRNRHTDRPPIAPCRIGMEDIAWRQSQAMPVGMAVLLIVYPNTDSALRLVLPGKVTQCRPSGSNAFNLVANIHDMMGDITQPMWEKWVFKRHRRAILDR